VSVWRLVDFISSRDAAFRTESATTSYEEGRPAYEEGRPAHEEGRPEAALGLGAMVGTRETASRDEANRFMVCLSCAVLRTLRSSREDCMSILCRSRVITDVYRQGIGAAVLRGGI